MVYKIFYKNDIKTSYIHTDKNFTAFLQLAGDKIVKVKFPANFLSVKLKVKSSITQRLKLRIMRDSLFY